MRTQLPAVHIGLLLSQPQACPCLCLQALWEPSRNTYAVNDAVATQQAQRGGSQAVAAGPRTVPAFSQFAASQAQAVQAEAAAEAEEGKEAGEAAELSPAGGAGEPPV